MFVDYRTGGDLPLDPVIDLYRSCSLGARRPIERPRDMADMLRNADLVVTAWEGDTLVGIARTLTDFAYVAYLSDLAVRETCQRRGIGRELVRRTREQLGPNLMLVLLAAPEAAGYYPRLGFEQHPSAWVVRPGADIT